MLFSHAGLQWTDGLGLRRAYADCRSSSAQSACRSEAVEPASLMYLKAEEEEELLSFHACKIQCRKETLSVIFSLHCKTLWIGAFSQGFLFRQGWKGFICRCCFQNPSSMRILSVKTSLGIRHLSIYLETWQKDRLIWEWILNKLLILVLSSWSTSTV